MDWLPDYALGSLQAPDDEAIDIVVAALRADPYLPRFCPTIMGIVPPPSFAAPIDLPAILVTAWSARESALPGLSANDVDLRVIFRYRVERELSGTKEPGRPSVAGVMWHIRRVLCQPDVYRLKRFVDGVAVELATETTPGATVPVGALVENRIVYDVAQPWRYTFHNSFATGRPWTETEAGG